MTLIAMAEEIGWRSYLLLRMQELLPRRRAAIVVGFCRGLFHLTLILFTSTYDSVGSRWVVAPMVLLSLTFAAVTALAAVLLVRGRTWGSAQIITR